MTIKAIVFDIGGVLEITPQLGITEKWEAQLNIPAGEMDKRLHHIWKGGSIGTISEEEVHKGIGEIIGMSEEQVNAFMDDIWREYLGTLNVELRDYFASLRARFKTGILSNSFVGARRKEQEAYGFEDLCDVMIYSHEVGMQKPDPRIYALTCERLGLQPSEIIFLDDREGAITPAIEHGIHGILFKDTAQAIADIEACIAANTAS